MAGVRAQARAETTAAILESARHQIARHGGVGLSMRAVAREVGLVSSAVYRYYPTREALLTAMIIESYGHLADHLAKVPGHSSAQRWCALAQTFRDWARSSPHEFQLIYGTPVPGYVAPPETIPAATAVAQPFLRCGGTEAVEFFDTPLLQRQLSPIAASLDIEPRSAGAVLAELAALVGFIGLELSGHFVGTADPADHLYDAVLRRQCRTLGLTPISPATGAAPSPDTPA